MKSQFLIIVVVVFLMNIINFLDRGIIPGASQEFIEFIEADGLSSNPDVYLGMLQSSFIIGYAIASIIFGHLCHYYPPFYLCIYGMVIWIAAVSFSGLAFYTKSYFFLFVTRMVSGVGEAAFQTSIPPWISKYAPPSHRGLCLSLFFTAIPCGTALGYAYAAAVATRMGWQYCFFIEGILMALFIPYLLCIAPDYPCESSSHSYSPSSSTHHQQQSQSQSQSHGTQTSSSSTQLFNMEASPRARSNSQISHTADTTIENLHKPTIISELKALIANPLYMFIVAGYAAQTGSLIGLTTFGSSFLIGLGFYDTETESSASFGLIVSIAGVLGTPLGGLIADVITTARKKIFEKKLDGIRLSHRVGEVIELQTNLGVIVNVNTVGACFLCLSYFIRSKTLFMFDLFCGAFFILLSGTSINLAVMMSVPEKHRAFAFGMSNLGLHLFGDVPSPVFTGYLKGKFAPHCTSQSATSAACRSENHGLRLTMLIMSSWTFVCVFYMFLAFLLSLALSTEDEPQQVMETPSKNHSTSASSPTSVRKITGLGGGSGRSTDSSEATDDEEPEHDEEHTLLHNSKMTLVSRSPITTPTMKSYAHRN